MSILNRNIKVEMPSNSFTVAEGIAIQEEHLLMWEQVLKEDVYMTVAKETTKNNHKAKTGYDITRGQSIYGIVSQIMYDWRNAKLKK